MKVERKRPDGFHDISSVFVPFSRVSDTVELSAGEPGIALHCNLKELETPANLVVRAADAYAQRSGIAPAWKFRLEKRIPIAAGMGGGSSDAAAVLRLLNEKYRKLPPERLAALAAEIGSDVPYFLNQVPALVSGRGEKIELLPELPVPPVVTVFPGFPVSAKWAYQHLAPARLGPGDPAPLLEAMWRRDWETAAAAMTNDLEYALLAKFPLLGMIAASMREAGGLKPQVTGSGSALFTICRTDDAADELRAGLAAEYPELTVI
ncbi:4-diphosphocytidyl-2-C-methyl-D-erythritol kinase [bioreactor metagenome]|uniref:4-(cytidine 5'-diphospho)-2-C-methyl-D-erythritol kinase n=1 Tax=bioreactor metagenome TaxID=1076179 RepID=A0A645D6Z5_9ZZZZ